MLSVDDAWENFISNNEDINANYKEEDDELVENNLEDIPKCSDIYISTQTKIAYLNQPIDLKNIFWAIPVIPYQSVQVGTVKKQMKVNCTSKEEVAVLEKKLKETENSVVIVDIISQIDNPNARKVKFKDVRKINIGLCKKDLTSYRTKRKGAFYNCFVLILRLKNGENYKESHVKIFNTGKLEIPGIQSSEYLYHVLDSLIEILQPHCDRTLEWKKDDIETVLINSNFTCNYYIDRDILAHRLKYEYNIHVVYDPCSYPGIQCKFYYNEDNTKVDGVCRCKKKCDKKGAGKGKNQCLEISFMIFRTGSVLIVGHCDEEILYKIYNFLKKILTDEYFNIKIDAPVKKTKPKVKKIWKKWVLIKT
jgi:TATA-box binding protein (TBP) (component of TFIID and TFIIIB)